MSCKLGLVKDLRNGERGVDWDIDSGLGSLFTLWIENMITILILFGLKNRSLKYIHLAQMKEVKQKSGSVKILRLRTTLS